MTEAERQKVYTLLSKFYPNARQLRDRATLTAWGYVLEKFTYEDVKAAVLSYAARNKYFPDLSDLTAGLIEQTPERGGHAAVTSPADLACMEASWALCERLGGTCPILSTADGMCGLALRRAVPDGCEGCRYLAVNGYCRDREKIVQEQSRCRILLRHTGEAPQAHLLESLWRSECPLCQSPCFWFEGMHLMEDEA